MLVGPTFGAVCYIAGTRQGWTVLYRENSYPFRALGDVTFLWRQLSTDSDAHDGAGTWNKHRQLWIWTHPACYSDVLSELKNVFRLTQADCKTIPESSGRDIHHSGEETMKSAMRKRKKMKKKDDASCPKRPKLKEADTVDAPQDTAVSQDAVVTHCKTVDKLTELSDESKAQSSATSVPGVSSESRGSVIEDSGKMKSKATVQCGDAHLLSKTELVRSVYENDNVRLESLKDDLCRFRLIGPKSHRVIVEALRHAEASSVHSSQHLTDNTDEVKSRWWDSFIASERGLTETVQQANSWQKLADVQNAAELPPFLVHGLTVRDPRLFLPQRRTSVSCCVRGESIYSRFFVRLCS